MSLLAERTIAIRLMILLRPVLHTTDCRSLVHLLQTFLGGLLGLIRHLGVVEGTVFGNVSNLRLAYWKVKRAEDSRLEASGNVSGVLVGIVTSLGD
jgi:hypothetical protein